MFYEKSCTVEGDGLLQTMFLSTLVSNMIYEYYIQGNLYKYVTLFFSSSDIFSSAFAIIYFSYCLFSWTFFISQMFFSSYCLFHAVHSVHELSVSHARSVILCFSIYFFCWSPKFGGNVSFNSEFHLITYLHNRKWVKPHPHCIRTADSI